MTNQLELERILDRIRHCVGTGGESIIETPSSVIANQILAVGFVKKDSIELDKKKRLDILY